MSEITLDLAAVSKLGYKAASSKINSGLHNKKKNVL